MTAKPLAALLVILVAGCIQDASNEAIPPPATEWIAGLLDVHAALTQDVVARTVDIRVPGPSDCRITHGFSVDKSIPGLQSVFLVERPNQAPAWSVWSQGGSYRVAAGPIDLQEASQPSDGAFLQKWTGRLAANATITVYSTGVGPKPNSTLGPDSFILTVACDRPYEFRSRAWTDARGWIGQDMMGGVQTQFDVATASFEGDIALPVGEAPFRNLLAVPPNAAGTAKYEQDSATWDWSLQVAEPTIFQADGFAHQRHQFSITYVGPGDYWMLLLSYPGHLKHAQAETFAKHDDIESCSRRWADCADFLIKRG